jgi:hypothetical protein
MVSRVLSPTGLLNGKSVPECKFISLDVKAANIVVAEPKLNISHTKTAV